MGFYELSKFDWVVDFQQVEAFHDLPGTDFVVLLGEELRDEGLVVGADGDHVAVLVHVGWLVFFGLADLFLEVLLDQLELLVLYVVVLVELDFKKFSEIYWDLLLLLLDRGCVV